MEIKYYIIFIVIIKLLIFDINFKYEDFILVFHKFYESRLKEFFLRGLSNTTKILSVNR